MLAVTALSRHHNSHSGRAALIFCRLREAALAEAASAVASKRVCDGADIILGGALRSRANESARCVTHKAEEARRWQLKSSKITLAGTARSRWSGMTVSCR